MYLGELLDYDETAIRLAEVSCARKINLIFVLDCCVRQEYAYASAALP